MFRISLLEEIDESARAENTVKEQLGGCMFFNEYHTLSGKVL